MKRILVRTPQWLGDAVVSTVFLTRLKAKFPDASITVLCSATLSALFETHPAVAGVLTWSYPQGSVFDTAKKIAAGKFDAVYILPRSFRAAFESAWAHVPRRVGYAGDFRRWLLTDVFSYDETRAYAHRYLKLIGEEDLPLDRVKPFFPSASAPLMESIKGRPLLGIAPISVAPARTWMPDRFAEVATAFLQQRGGAVVLFGSPSERARVQAVADKITGPVLNAAGQLSLPELGGAIRECDLFLCNDSGLMHVASCFDVPTVVVFGASEPSRALPPWGRFHALQHKEIFCVPCLRNECARLGDDQYACLKAVQTNEVLEKLAL